MMWLECDKRVEDVFDVTQASILGYSSVVFYFSTRLWCNNLWFTVNELDFLLYLLYSFKLQKPLDVVNLPLIQFSLYYVMDAYPDKISWSCECNES